MTTKKTKTAKTKQPSSRLRVGLVVPHIFMHRDILPRVIFSPGTLALDLVQSLSQAGAEVTLFSPGPMDGVEHNSTADLTYFERELAGRGDTYIDLLKKHPFTFVTLARQVQSEIIGEAFAMANRGKLDIVHIYTNEEDVALPFVQFCTKPVVLTHHDPFNFLVRYKSVFPKYKHLNWLSMSLAQRASMPEGTQWAGNIYHGLDDALWHANLKPKGDYVAYFGRIIQPKGVHLAIAAIKRHNETAVTPLKLKIAGKHYAEHAKDTYWQQYIEPQLGGMIEYVGFIGDVADKQAFLGNAQALLVPSIFDEPFGMGVIEALACGTPVIGLDSGALPEIITPDCGRLIAKQRHSDGTLDETATSQLLGAAVGEAQQIDRTACRQAFEARFTLRRMAEEHMAAYQRLIKSSDRS